MRPAFVCIDLDFFTKPYYKGSFYEERDWISKTDFKAQASKWMHTQDFISKIPIQGRVRGNIVKQDNQPIFYLSDLIKSKYFQPKMFDIISFDAHHDMYMWNDNEYYSEKTNLSDYKPFDVMLAPFQQEWVNNFIWVHPDYVTSSTPDLKSLYPNAKIKSIQWSDWKWDNHEVKYLMIITNQDMAIINEGMLEDFEKIIQVW